MQSPNPNSPMPSKIYLKDYKAPQFSLLSTSLSFELKQDYVLVDNYLEFQMLNGETNLFLDGVGLELLEIKLNGNSPHYQLSPQGLLLENVPSEFKLFIKTKIYPEKNTSLEGLYKSGSYLVTQCEAQGFRKITYFPDRPDVMTSFTVRIVADKKNYPLLLSNGDCTKKRELPEGLHEATWHDPHKKPAYLFALVAGDLGLLEDNFTTKSGKNVKLQIFSPHGTQDRCEHAMVSLKKSMLWDEKRFGREYDLSTYMIVAIDDFNAGAMENKGLNIFNSRLVFANPRTATDADYHSIESVVAHEYFHNWTGNRVTLRDWFHLSLKEGLTVFRDQEFSMDEVDRDLIRIQSVDDLRNSQFAEDAGPNAHPIRPESCYAVDNFFTSTIYEKGSEVIRMMQTIVGRPGFRKGMDLYFSRHDGQAVTIEDFAKAIAEANQQDWEQFKLWYSQAGTPKVEAKAEFNPPMGEYQLTLTQSCAITSQEAKENKTKQPFHIPLEIELLDEQGKSLDLSGSKQISKNTEGKNIFHLTKATDTLKLQGLTKKPIYSLNRGFSAPINLSTDQSKEDLCFLLKKDSDLFNRWEASQTLYTQELLRAYKSPSSFKLDSNIVTSIKEMLIDTQLSPAMKAELLQVPSVHVLIQRMTEFSPSALSETQVAFYKAMFFNFGDFFEDQYLKIHGMKPETMSQEDIALRRLKNTYLHYLSYGPKAENLVLNQALESRLMTDEQAALQIGCRMANNCRQQIIDNFYNKWQSESLVLNKWFSAQANADHDLTFSTVKSLFNHRDFVKTNPNRVYSLLRVFGDNLTQMWLSADRVEYFTDRVIEIDRINPQVATRLAAAYDPWKQLPLSMQTQAKSALQRIIDAKPSKNTFEIISKALEA